MTSKENLLLYIQRLVLRRQFVCAGLISYLYTKSIILVHNELFLYQWLDRFNFFLTFEDDSAILYTV